MVHILPQGNSKGVAKMYMANMSYAYDVASKGMVSKTVTVQDISSLEVAKYPTCPFPYGACVSGGGTVIGVDYLGQLVTDDTGTVAFYRVHECDEGALWTNQFGLPYAYAQGVGTDVTFTEPTDDGDHRGTFTTSTFDAPIALAYIPIAGNLHGDAYAPEDDSGGGGDVLAITEPLDGATLDDPIYDISGGGAVAGTTVQLWSDDRDPDVDPPNATATADDAGLFAFTGDAPAYGTVTWTVVNEGVTSASITVTSPEQEPQSPNAGGDIGGDDSLQVPQRFNSHADSDAWLADNNLPTPDGWGSMTLTDKATLVNKLYGYSSDV